MKGEPLAARTPLALVDGRPVHGRLLAPRPLVPSPSRPLAALLLIHGVACSADVWTPALRCLERESPDRPVIAPDMPGYGHSPGPPEALGIDALADWSARLLDALAIPTADVAGNSMGCQVALVLARRHPARVGRIVLAGPTTGRRWISLGRYLFGLLLDGTREPAAYNLLLLRMFRQMGPRRYFATARQMLEDDPLTRPEQIPAPCLVVRGERDAIVPAPVARRLAEVLPSGSFAEVEGAAHAVQFSAPERFTRIALAFLGEAPRPIDPPRAGSGTP